MQTEPSPPTPDDVEPATPPEPTSWWKRMRARWWFRWATDGLLMIAVIWVIFAWQGRNLLDDRTAAPPLALTSMEGARVDLQSLAGKQVVLAFWAPWCTVCAAETGMISSLHRSVGPDVVVLSVVLGWDDRAQVEAWMTEHGVDYPVLLGDRAVADAWKIDRFPTIYILDEQGAIKDATVGYSTEWGVRARLLL